MASQPPKVLESSAEQAQISFIQGYLYFQVGHCLPNRATQVMADVINGVKVVAFIGCGGLLKKIMIGFATKGVWCEFET
jgi:hypothetical protein